MHTHPHNSCCRLSDMFLMLFMNFMIIFGLLIAVDFSSMIITGILDRGIFQSIQYYLILSGISVFMSPIAWLAYIFLYSVL